MATEGKPAMSNDEPYEDPTLDASESLVSDDLAKDPLDPGVIPPDRYTAAEKYGTTAEEAARGESLDMLLAEEEPDTGPGGAGETDEDPVIDDRWPHGPGPRTGRLTLDTTEEGSGDAVADDVGIDAGAATAEEAAMHVEEDELPFE
jgi:hypothetical protein